MTVWLRAVFINCQLELMGHFLYKYMGEDGSLTLIAEFDVYGPNQVRERRNYQFWCLFISSKMKLTAILLLVGIIVACLVLSSDGKLLNLLVLRWTTMTTMMEVESLINYTLMPSLHICIGRSRDLNQNLTKLYENTTLLKRRTKLIGKCLLPSVHTDARCFAFYKFVEKCLKPAQNRSVQFI